MKKLLAIGILALGMMAYAGEKEAEQGSDRLSRPMMLELFEGYGNRF